MKILKFNEGSRTDFYKSTIEDIINIITPLTDGGFQITEKYRQDSFFRITLALPPDDDIESYGETFRSFYLDMGKDADEEYNMNKLEKFESFNRFVKVVSDNIEEIKDRLNELVNNNNIKVGDFLISPKLLTISITMTIKERRRKV